MNMENLKPHLNQFIKFYYEELGNYAGGRLHICLDDGNLEESHIYFCQEECLKNGDSFGYFLATLMRHFTTEELEALYDRGWGDGEANNNSNEEEEHPRR